MIQFSESWQSLSAVEKARRLLDAGDWVCGDRLVEAGVGYRYAARIADLKALGIDVEARRCVHPDHRHRGGTVEYRIAPSELVLFGVAG